MTSHSTVFNIIYASRNFHSCSFCALDSISLVFYSNIEVTFLRYFFSLYVGAVYIAP